MTYLDRLSPEVYVAIRAIWLLWRRGHWDALAEIGLSSASIHSAFEAFSDKKYRVVTNSVTIELLLSLPQQVQDDVLTAALVLAVSYAALFHEVEETNDLPLSVKDRRIDNRNNQSHQRSSKNSKRQRRVR
jgi:hypothetical protein